MFIIDFSEDDVENIFQRHDDDDETEVRHKDDDDKSKLFINYLLTQIYRIGTALLLIFTR